MTGSDECTDGSDRIVTGDALEELAELPEAFAHAVVTDPPYGLAFMGRSWDDFEPKEYQEFCEEWAKEVKRVLKPGGHLLAFSGNRTHHRLFTGVEDAGFEIRDTLTWHYGSGFPKASDISKTIDKRADAEREVVGEYTAPDGNGRCNDVGIQGGNYANKSEYGEETKKETAPATSEAKKWDGWKTGLKPATEYVVMARKTFDGATVDCVLEHGTGALNIDSCRVEHENGGWTRKGPKDDITGGSFGDQENDETYMPKGGVTSGADNGRYPSNVVFDATEAERLDNEVGELDSGGPGMGNNYEYHTNKNPNECYSNDERNHQISAPQDSGGPSRYFKTVSWDDVAKALNAESTKDKIDCQLCSRTLVTSAETRTKRTQAKPGSSVATNATSTQSAGQTGGKNTTAKSAEQRLKNTQAKDESTAQKSATESQNESVKQSNANTAEQSSKQSQATSGNTAQNRASQKTSTENTSKQTGTTTTLNESEKSSKSDTTTNQSSEKRSKHGPKQTGNTPKASPVKSVELPAQIGTTTTTITLLTCAGCAEAVTSKNTKKNTAAGAQDSPKRYKYTSKASKSERTENGKIENSHPTVKPQDLMEWLVKLVTKENQLVIDPFCGSGTTLKACKKLNREFIGIEKQPKWADVARVRCGLSPIDASHVRGDECQSGLEEFFAQTDGGKYCDVQPDTE